MKVPTDSVVVVYQYRGAPHAVRFEHNERLTVLACMKLVKLYSPYRPCFVNGMRTPHRKAVPGGSVVVLGAVTRGAV